MFQKSTIPGIGILLALFLCSGCAWVKPTPEGEKVRVLEAADVSQCKKIGTTRVSLLDKVAGIQRGREKVQSELNILARNSAARMDGDTVVAISTIEEGSQEFAVYQCVPR